MPARTGSTAGKATVTTADGFLWRFARAENKQKWRGAFDSFVAPSRPSTSEERPLGGEEEGGVRHAADRGCDIFLRITQNTFAL